MKACPKFIVTRVQGKAVGGGVGVVAGSDYVVATSAAAVRLSEFELGIGPFTVGPAVERKVGKAAFAAMSIDCDWRDAAWCKAHGLFTEVVDDIAALDAKVSELATKLSDASPAATKELKAVTWEGAENWETLLPARAKISGELLMAKKEA